MIGVLLIFGGALVATSFGFLTALPGLPLLIVSIVLFSANRKAMKAARV